MKVILSAFSCEPDMGSEEAVGWGWVTGLAQRCDKVLVVTRTQYREKIEAWLLSHPLDNVEFLYFRPVGAALFKKTLGRFEWLPHYLLWQRGIIEPIRAAMAVEQYDLVHHVTVVSMRFSVKVGELGIPFVYGPIAGGDEAPMTTWRGMTWQGKLAEVFRNGSNRLLRRSPSIRRTLSQASRIITVSPQTTALIPDHLRSRVAEVLAISYDEPIRYRTMARRESPTLKMLFAARCVDYKGLHIGLYSLARALRSGADVHLTVMGDGPALPHWKRIAQDLGLDNHITWTDGLPRAAFIQALSRYDLLFFPSLHDSGALVVLEALANGLPVLCLDAGGPGQLVDDQCGIKVKIETRDQIETELADSLVRLAADEDLRLSMARHCAKRIADHFVLDRKIDAVIAHYPGYLPSAKDTVRTAPRSEPLGVS